MTALKSIKIKTRTQNIWIRGVLIMGGVVFIGHVLINLYRGTLNPGNLLQNFIISLLSGYIFGIVLWRYAKKRKIPIKSNNHAIKTSNGEGGIMIKSALHKAKIRPPKLKHSKIISVFFLLFAFVNPASYPRDPFLCASGSIYPASDDLIHS